VVGVPAALWRALRLQAGGSVMLTQGQGSVVLPAREEANLADGTLRVSAGHPATAALGAMFGTLSVENVKA
jgi:NADH-quinone oxidoreductase subunit G